MHQSGQTMKMDPIHEAVITAAPSSLLVQSVPPELMAISKSSFKQLQPHLVERGGLGYWQDHCGVSVTVEPQYTLGWKLEGGTGASAPCLEVLCGNGPRTCEVANRPSLQSLPSIGGESSQAHSTNRRFQPSPACSRPSSELSTCLLLVGCLSVKSLPLKHKRKAWKQNVAV